MLAYWDLEGFFFGMRESCGSKTLRIQVMPGHGYLGNKIVMGSGTFALSSPFAFFSRRELDQLGSAC